MAVSWLGLSVGGCLVLSCILHSLNELGELNSLNSAIP